MHSANDPEELNEKGKNQIKTTANHLKKYKIKIVYCSGEKRAIQSAEIISKILGIPLNVIGGFQERNWGNLSGKPWSEIKAILDPMSLEERYAFVPPNGESWQVFEDRLISSLNEVIKANPEKNILIVSHGGAIRALMPFLLKIPIEESFKYDPDNASLTVFELNKSGLINESVNNIDHLPENLKSLKK